MRLLPIVLALTGVACVTSPQDDPDPAAEADVPIAEPEPAPASEQPLEQLGVAYCYYHDIGHANCVAGWSAVGAAVPILGGALICPGVAAGSSGAATVACVAVTATVVVYVSQWVSDYFCPPSHDGVSSQTGANGAVSASISNDNVGFGVREGPSYATDLAPNSGSSSNASYDSGTPNVSPDDNGGVCGEGSEGEGGVCGGEGE